MSKLKTYKLNQLCDITSSKRIFSEEYVSDGIPFYRSKEIIEKAFGQNITESFFISKDKFNEIKSKFGIPKQGEILISSVGARSGIPYLIRKDDGEFYFKDGNLIWLRSFSKDLISQYLIYWLQSSVGQNSLQSIMIGSAQPALTIIGVSGLSLKIPSISEQQKIIDVLSALDAKIELNNRINAELESLAKTIYDYWFVQFDFPNADGKPYKSSGGEMVYVEEGKGDRAIPAGWEVKKLGKVLKTALGGTPSTKEPKYWLNGDIPWLNSGEISNFPIISSEKCVTQAGIDSSAASLLPKGSVVVSIVRYIRPSILAIDACANQSVLGIYESDKLLNSFIYPYLVSQVPRLMSLRTGAQQPHINKETIDTSLIVIPQNDVLLSYYKIAHPLFKEIMNIAFQNQQLTQLRDWLLPMLMNGQVSIK
jgi:type I restriction enzyme S subunit